MSKLFPFNMFLLCFSFSIISCGQIKQDTSDIPGMTSEKKSKVEPEVISHELLELEAEYMEMLTPITKLKQSKPKTYWFIVSWLKTAYKTPDWNGYGEDDWREKTKQRGIDCSGFTRVMQDQIFDYKIAGGSQGLLDMYCTQVPASDRKMGDLVFFKAPYSTTDRIVHVGVYLQDGLFVHATSVKSAANGLGLKIDSLEDQRWKDELVAIGRVNEEHKK
ncbi:C40 family peptidase [Saprospiraceae bacterium]|nr:C40 family peptidase [Saprospiraceae bacterium]